MRFFHSAFSLNICEFSVQQLHDMQLMHRDDDSNLAPDIVICILSACICFILSECNDGQTFAEIISLHMAIIDR